MPRLPDSCAKYSFSPMWWGYRTPREIIVADVPTAVFYRVLQLVVICTTLSALIDNNQWAYSEAPEATANVWVESTSAYTAARDQADLSSLPYCSSADYTYTYSEQFVYEQPECRAMALEQIVRKLDGVVYIMTQFRETVEAGWPCSQTDAIPETTCNSSLFDAHPGEPTLTTRASGQTVTVFPVGVESLAVKFEHTFKTKQTFSDVWAGTGTIGKGKTLRGSSSMKPCSDSLATDDACDSDSSLTESIVQNYTGARVPNPGADDGKFPLGEPISMLVREWLDVAGPSGKCDDTGWCDNRTLDFPNDKLKKDTDGAHPYLRVTGVAVNMELHYSNLNSGGKAELYNDNVRAEVRSTVELGAWAGLGGESEYIDAPVSDGQGRVTYRMVTRYGQGLIFRLRPGGALYVFELMYLINVLVAGVVGLAAVNILMDVVVKYLLPNGVSQLMNSKKCEIVSKANATLDR